MAILRAYAPASCGNLAPSTSKPADGSLWGDVVEAEPAARDSFELCGPYAYGLPRDARDNLVLRARALLEPALGGELPRLRLRLDKQLPLRSGLGSSSASIVAALVALNAAAGSPLTPCELLPFAGRAEGSAAGDVHLDNVAACLLGGLRLVTPDGATRALPFPDDLRLVVVHPELELATAEARAVLPRQVALGLAVEHAANLAALVHALHADDRALLAGSLRDLLAEPHRAALVPGFRAVQRAALDRGALGASLSGAGPALFALAGAESAQEVGAAMTGAFAGAGVACQARVCRLDTRGARLL